MDPYGPELPLDSIEEKPEIQLKFVWAVGFFLLWGMVLKDLFFGQIINAFQIIQQDKWDKERDSEQRCLVCSLERNVFELRRENGFNEHVNHHHDPLNYVFFVNTLMRSEVEEMNGLESYCYNALKSGAELNSAGGAAPAIASLSGSADGFTPWIPVKRACALKQ